MARRHKSPPRQSTSAALPSTACSAFYAALRRMLDRGQARLSANCLAMEMWPDARHNNSHGQSFNLAAGVAGRMLRKYRGCWEVEPRVWEIVPEFIPPNNKSTNAGNWDGLDMDGNVVEKR